MEHVSEYIWFGSVSPALLTDRSDIKGYYPFVYFNGYGNDVLPMYRLFMFARKPVVCEFVLWLSRRTDELSCSINDGIINAKSDSHSGEGCSTFIVNGL